jgi:hypothetical protein
MHWLNFYLLVFMYIFIFSLSFFIMFFSKVYAVSPISQIGSPIVTKGELAIESRTGITADADETSANHHRIFMRQHINYGVTDDYATRIVLRQNKFRNNNTEHSLVAWEHHFQFTDKEHHGFDSGMRIIYVDTHDNYGKNVWENRYLLQTPFGADWQYRFNGIFSYQTGNNPNGDIGFEMRHQIVTPARFLPSFFEHASIGFEVFNYLNTLANSGHYDSQNHQIGGILRGNLKNSFYMQTHYRVGISNQSPDHILGFSVGKKFNFLPKI